MTDLTALSVAGLAEKVHRWTPEFVLRCVGKGASEEQVEQARWNETLEVVAELLSRAEEAERLQAERDAATAALQHFKDCADTPLMRDVLAERDDLRTTLAGLKKKADKVRAEDPPLPFAMHVSGVAREVLGRYPKADT